LTHPDQRIRVVFDTNTVISALAFTAGRLAWLRAHWRERRSLPLVSQGTAAELKWVLGYRKLKLSPEYQIELLGDYLSYCEIIGVREARSIRCRDVKDQLFLDLAQSGQADVLVTGDDDLLALAGQTAFAIESPEDYRRRISVGQEKR
jgi:putative PIN family toxin of toxin-antitoxin system